MVSVGDGPDAAAKVHAKVPAAAEQVAGRVAGKLQSQSPITKSKTSPPI